MDERPLSVSPYDLYAHAAARCPIVVDVRGENTLSANDPVIVSAIRRSHSRASA